MRTTTRGGLPAWVAPARIAVAGGQLGQRLARAHPEAARPFRVPLPLGRAPVPAMLGLGVVVLLLAGFEPPVYGIAGAALALAFVVQALPWKQDLLPGESPP